jgi:hypothetical protein
VSRIVGIRLFSQTLTLHPIPAAELMAVAALRGSE